MIITIDGPAGAGKTTVAAMLAQRLGYKYIDTGAMYRALTWEALKRGIDLSSEETLAQLARAMDMSCPLDEELRGAQVEDKVSLVASYKKVRAALVCHQRRLAERASGAIVEGRDIGTIVFPDAEHKFFLTASLPERARRKAKELSKKGIKADYIELMNRLSRRDSIDSRREVSPLRKAQDAVVINTTCMTQTQVTNEIIDKLVAGKCKRPGL